MFEFHRVLETSGLAPRRVSRLTRGSSARTENDDASVRSAHIWLATCGAEVTCCAPWTRACGPLGHSATIDHELPFKRDHPGVAAHAGKVPELQRHQPLHTSRGGLRTILRDLPDLPGHSREQDMRLGIWAPLPHTIRPEAEIMIALDELGTHGLGLPQDRSFRFLVDIVLRAEELGFDTTLVAERLVARDLESWVVSSALAVLTSRIQIMTAVHPGMIQPQMVAKMGASLDRLTGGRFAVNVIPGRRAQEFDLFGNGSWLADTQQRYKRMQEFIDVLDGMWTQKAYNLEGEYYKVAEGELTTRPMTHPRPPIFAASGSDYGKEIIAQYCDTWFISHEPGLAAYESNTHKIATDIADMRARAGRHGRTLGYGLSTYVICADTLDAALHEAAEMEQIPEANVAAKALGAGLVGTPDMIADRIRRYEDDGIACLMLQFHPMREGLETFAAKVMPLIR